MAGAFISATTISCNTGEGSVPTLKLSCTTPWVSTVLPSSTRSCPMSPTSVTSSWRVRTNSQAQLYYPMGFRCSAVFNAQLSHVTDKCNIMSPLDPVQHCVTSCPRWILSNTDGWIMQMVVPESTNAIIGIPLAPILWYNFPDNLYSKLSLVQMTLLHDQPQNPGSQTQLLSVSWHWSTGPSCRWLGVSTAIL